MLGSQTAADAQPTALVEIPNSKLMPPPPRGHVAIDCPAVDAESVVLGGSRTAGFRGAQGTARFERWGLQHKRPTCPKYLDERTFPDQPLTKTMAMRHRHTRGVRERQGRRACCPSPIGIWECCPSAREVSCACTWTLRSPGSTCSLHRFEPTRSFSFLESLSAFMQAPSRMRFLT